MIHTLLFDLDGTLMDTWDLYIEAYLRALEPHVGRRLDFQELVALRPTSELRLLQRLYPHQAGAVHRAFLDHYRTLHPSHFGGVYPGVTAMLDDLRRRGLDLGIVTGKSRGAWTISQAHCRLGQFAVAVHDDDVGRPKPDPEGLHLALARLEADPAGAVYVGDSVGDALAARDAGMAFAAALWPKAPEELPEFLDQVRSIGVWRELSRPGDLVTTLDGDSRGRWAQITPVTVE